MNETIDVSQNNTALSAQHVNGTIFGSPHTSNGTISGNTFTLSLADPINSTNGVCSYSIGGTSVNTLTSETTGNGTINLNVANIGGDCSALGLPCAVTYTGTWQKIGTGTTGSTSVPAVQPTSPTVSNPTPEPQPTSAPQVSTPTPKPQPTSAPQEPTPTPKPQPTSAPTASPSYSCSPKKSCPNIGSCEEAYWYLKNCSGWEEYIDTNYDGVPCERSLCK